MAKVKKLGRKYCVTHGTTGQVLKRKGKRACYTSASRARTDARKTRCKVMGGKSC